MKALLAAFVARETPTSADPGQTTARLAVRSPDGSTVLAELSRGGQDLGVISIPHSDRKIPSDQVPSAPLPSRPFPSEGNSKVGESRAIPEVGTSFYGGVGGILPGGDNNPGNPGQESGIPGEKSRDPVTGERAQAQASQDVGAHHNSHYPKSNGQKDFLGAPQEFQADRPGIPGLAPEVTAGSPSSQESQAPAIQHPAIAEGPSAPLVRTALAELDAIAGNRPQSSEEKPALPPLVTKAFLLRSAAAAAEPARGPELPPALATSQRGEAEGLPRPPGPGTELRRDLMGGQGENLAALGSPVSYVPLIPRSASVSGESRPVDVGVSRPAPVRTRQSETGGAGVGVCEVCGMVGELEVDVDRLVCGGCMVEVEGRGEGEVEVAVEKVGGLERMMGQVEAEEDVGGGLAEFLRGGEEEGE